MNQFVVPQFLEVEDKIIGPITVRQFLILLVTSLILFIVFKLTDLQLFLIISVPLGGMAAILAFAKVNGQTFHYFLLNIVQTLKRPSRRVWNKRLTTTELNDMRKRGPVDLVEEPIVTHAAEHHHIRTLSLMVNTGGYYKGE